MVALREILISPEVQKLIAKVGTLPAHMEVHRLIMSAQSTILDQELAYAKA